VFFHELSLFCFPLKRKIGTPALFVPKFGASAPAEAKTSRDSPANGDNTPAASVRIIENNSAPYVKAARLRDFPRRAQKASAASVSPQARLRNAVR
jgi:hypothetical protein